MYLQTKRTFLIYLLNLLRIAYAFAYMGIYNIICDRPDRAQFYLHNAEGFLAADPSPFEDYSFLSLLVDIASTMMCMCAGGSELINIAKCFARGYSLLNNSNTLSGSKIILEALVEAFSEFDDTNITKKRCCCWNSNEVCNCGCKGDEKISVSKVRTVTTQCDLALQKLFFDRDTAAWNDIPTIRLTILLVLYGIEIQQSVNQDENSGYDAADRIATLLVPSSEQQIDNLLPIAALPIALAANIHLIQNNKDALTVELLALQRLAQSYPIVNSRFGGTILVLTEAVNQITEISSAFIENNDDVLDTFNIDDFFLTE
jgi:hypothetical protein